MITQKWIDGLTDDGPDVIGPPAQMPEYRKRYIAAMTVRGVTLDFAEASFAASEHDSNVTPEDAAESEMEAWTDDGD